MGERSGNSQSGLEGPEGAQACTRDKMMQIFSSILTNDGMIERKVAFKDMLIDALKKERMSRTQGAELQLRNITTTIEGLATSVHDLESLVDQANEGQVQLSADVKHLAGILERQSSFYGASTIF